MDQYEGQKVRCSYMPGRNCFLLICYMIDGRMHGKVDGKNLSREGRGGLLTIAPLNLRA